LLRLAGASAIAAVLLGPHALAQDPQPQFKTGSELVVLHVLVTDHSGAYVPGLDAKAFHLYDENRPQTPKFFLSEDAPVTVGLLIDSSGSMGHVRDRVIAAATEFVQSSNPDDEVFALVFNDEVQNVLGGNFTSDPIVLQGALARAFQPIGRTALYDAVVAGLEYAAKGSHDRRVLVVLSDGGDNASIATLKDVVTRVQSSNTVIYSVALVDPNDYEANPGKLRQLSETSGGESFSPKDVLEVRKAFEKIARDVRHMYTIGFEPTNSAYHAGFHRVRVDVTDREGKRLTVKSRSGYLKTHVGP
jgi:VWFA-related protein